MRCVQHIKTLWQNDIMRDTGNIIHSMISWTYDVHCIYNGHSTELGSVMFSTVGIRVGV